jgi:hypothetical protein
MMPLIETPNQVLVRIGRDKGVLSLTGKPHHVMQAYAEHHAHYQALRLTAGHQNWAARREKLIKAAPDARGFTEVCVASWKWNTLPEPAAVDIFESWQKSPGHWSVVNGRYQLWSYAMTQGRDGRWFACGIMAMKK